MSKLFYKNSLDGASKAYLLDIAQQFGIQYISKSQPQLVQQILKHPKNQTGSISFTTKKAYSKKALRAMTQQQLTKLARRFKIKLKGLKSKDVIHQIFNHHHNIMCNQNDEFKCTVFNCQQHVIKKWKRGNLLLKKTPTNFGRRLPTCWFIASIQLLGELDWSQAFAELYQREIEHPLSRYLDLIFKARYDLSGQSFNVTPVSVAFINRFMKDQPDWTITRQQDACEFLTCFLGNIDAKGKNAKKAFFPEKDKLDPLQLEMIDFMKTKLSLDVSEHIKCKQCGHKWLGTRAETSKEMMLILAFPHEEQIQFINGRPTTKRVPITHGQTIQTLLNQFLQTEGLDKDHKCENCKVKGKTEKTFELDSTPEYLLLNVKRWDFDNVDKIDAAVGIEELINLPVSNRLWEYKLLATLDHTGDTMRQGHYTTTKRVRDTLFNCNDNHSIRVSRFNNKDVYCLLYIKTNKSAVLSNSGIQSIANITHSTGNKNLCHTKKNNQNIQQHKTKQQQIMPKHQLAITTKKTIQSSATTTILFSNKNLCNTKKNHQQQLQLEPKNISPQMAKQKQITAKIGDKEKSTNVVATEASQKLPKLIKSHKCPLCERVLKTERGLRSHIAQKHKDAIKCQCCQQLCENVHGLQTHMGMKHPEVNSNVCLFCGEKFVHPNKLKIHLEIRHQQKHNGVKCDHCSQLFPDEHSLATHIGMKHVKSKKSSPKRKRKQKQNNSKHPKSKKKKSSRKRKRDSSSSALPNEPPAKKAKRATKASAQKKKASRKRKLKSSSSSLPNQPPLKKAKTATKVDQKGKKIPNARILCKCCSKSFKIPAYFHKHMAAKHPNQKKCEHCLEYFHGGVGLQTHIGMAHKDVVSNKCPHCEKEFKVANKLKKHIKERHSIIISGKSIKCPKCTQCFISKEGLNRHIGQVHKVEIPAFDPTFDFTTAVHCPSYQEVQEYRLDNPDYNVAGFLKMIGPNSADPQIKPKEEDVCFKVNKKDILEKWKENMNHDVEIKICGTCGKQVLKVEGEYHILRLKSPFLQCFKANINQLPPKDSYIYQSLHLFETKSGDIFKVCDKAVEKEKELILICDMCHDKLEYAVQKGQPPRHTLAYYDLGKKPDKLQRLSLGEKLAMSKVIVFVPQIQFKAVYGTGQKGIKGHAFGIKASEAEILKSVVNSLPRSDLNEVIHISLCGPPEFKNVAARILTQASGHLDIKAARIIPWLTWFQDLKNPDFVNVKIRSVTEADKLLQQSIDKILENIFQTNSKRVADLMSITRAEIRDQEEGLNEGIDNNSIMRNALITQDVAEVEPLNAILKDIQETLAESSSTEESKVRIV